MSVAAWLAAANAMVPRGYTGDVPPRKTDIIIARQAETTALPPAPISSLAAGTEYSCDNAVCAVHVSNSSTCLYLRLTRRQCTHDFKLEDGSPYTGFQLGKCGNDLGGVSVNLT